jgi:outer membrane usher protein
LFCVAAARGMAVEGDAVVLSDGKDWVRGTSVYLEVTVNATPSGRIAHFDERNGELYARVATLRRLGIVPPESSEDPLRLAALPGASVAYDKAAQRLALVVPVTMLDAPTTRLSTHEAQPAPVAPSAPGVLVGYDVYAARGDGIGNVAASLQARVFGIGAGVLDDSRLLRYIDRPGEGWAASSLRLDTRWQFAFPDSMLRVNLGDAITQALPWTRATRFGGIAIGTDFSLQPYRVTTPLTQFLGQATLPSAVDLYINGVKQYSGNVPAGPFQLSAVPTVNGAGSAQVVLTDALGRRSVIDLSLYATNRLLQAGLADWSLELGPVRENYGVASFDYATRPMASGTWRYGVNDAFTVETHAEAVTGLRNAGFGGNWLLGTRGGVLSLAYARSDQHGSSGALRSWGYAWAGRWFNAAVASLRTSGDYRDVASVYGPPPARIVDTAFFGVTTPTLGNLGVNFLRQQYPGQARTRYAGLFWSQTIAGRWAANVSLNRDLGSSGGNLLFASLTYTPAERLSFTAAVQRDRGDTSSVLEAGRSVPGDGGFGWRVDVRQGDHQDGGAAEADWLGDHGRLRTGVSAFGDSRYGYAEAIGSIVFIGGHGFLAREVDNAFALVSTGDIGNVPVTLENRTIGQTGADGLLLVTPLNAYQRNQIGIDPLGLPAGVRVDQVAMIATPSDRAGAVVEFGLRRTRAAVLILQDAQRQPIALGSRVQVEGQAAQVPVGFDGEVYLEDLHEHEVVRVHTGQGLCSVRLDYPIAAAGSVPRLGPLPCLVQPQ